MPETLRRLKASGRGWQVWGRTNASAAAIDALNSKALAAFGTAASENLATSTGGHTRAETVGALTFYFAGLISTLHAGISTMS